MKKLYILLAFVATIATFAQAPQGFNYQATVRNSAGALIVNQIVLVKFKIYQNTATGTLVYSENQTANTDDLGHIALVVGQGTATVGTFSAINWGSGSYFLGIELNTGSGYVAMGTTQLLSVPYALYANSSGNSQAATPNLAAVLAVNNGANNLQIKNLADPTDVKDAVNKSFLSTQLSQLQAQITALQNSIINVIATPSNASICSGSSTAISLSSYNANITYSWTASCISGQITGFSNQSQSSVSIINQILRNMGTAPGIVRYVVTPHLGSTSGQSINIDVTVNGPYIQVTTMPLYLGSACHNQPANPLGGPPNPDYTYQWCIGSNDALSSIPIPGATNSTFIPPTNNVGVTMYSCLMTNRFNPCDYFYSAPIQFTVNPKPIISNKTITINSGSSFLITPQNIQGDFVPAGGTSYDWTVSNTSGVIGASNQVSYQSISQILTNITNIPQTVVYTVTPSTNNCIGNPFTITVTVNPPTTPLPNVTIGTQIWSSTNLDLTTYRDGTPIPQVTDPTAWANLTTGAWCYYANNAANGTTFGKLYNWYAVAGIHDNDPNTPNKILAPTGWHVPSDAEWTSLITFLGGSSVAGGKMKSTNTLWQSPNTGANNESGFTGLPGGLRYYLDGVYFDLGGAGNWWSSSEFNTTSGWFYHLISISSSTGRFNGPKTYGLSVRLVKD